MSLGEQLRLSRKSRCDVDAPIPRGKRDVCAIGREIRLKFSFRAPAYLNRFAAGGLLYPDMHQAAASVGYISQQLAISRERGAAKCSRSDVFGFRGCGLLRPFP